MKDKFFYILLFLFMSLLLFAPQRAEASHTVSHWHYTGTSYNVYYTTNEWIDSCTMKSTGWIVDMNYYDVYDHKYVLLDMWYNEYYAGYNAYSVTYKYRQSVSYIDYC